MPSWTPKIQKVAGLKKTYFLGFFRKIDFSGSFLGWICFKRIYSDSAHQAEQEYIFRIIFNGTVYPPGSPETIFFILWGPLFVNFSQVFPGVLGSIFLCHSIRQMLPYKSIRVDFFNFLSFWKKNRFYRKPFLKIQNSILSFRKFSYNRTET